MAYRITCQIKNGQSIKTQGNFLVLDASGSRVAAFAVEEDAKLFVEAREQFEKRVGCSEATPYRHAHSS